MKTILSVMRMFTAGHKYFIKEKPAETCNQNPAGFVFVLSIGTHVKPPL